MEPACLCANSAPAIPHQLARVGPKKGKQQRPNRCAARAAQQVGSVRIGGAQFERLVSCSRGRVKRSGVLGEARVVATCEKERGRLQPRDRGECVQRREYSRPREAENGGHLWSSDGGYQRGRSAHRCTREHDRIGAPPAQQVCCRHHVAIEPRAIAPARAAGGTEASEIERENSVTLVGEHPSERQPIAEVSMKFVPEGDPNFPPANHDSPQQDMIGSPERHGRPSLRLCKASLAEDGSRRCGRDASREPEHDHHQKTEHRQCVQRRRRKTIHDLTRSPSLRPSADPDRLSAPR
jgi:hypothetical protein